MGDHSWEIRILYQELTSPFILQQGTASTREKGSLCRNKTERKLKTKKKTEWQTMWCYNYKEELKFEIEK